MATPPVYKYQPLDTSQGEIRLITLYPGKPGDDLHITISHEPLVPASDIQSSRLTLSELRQTLPKRWHAEQAVDGRYFFWEDSASRPISWNHPDGTMDPQKYTQADYTRPLATTPFEALSYTWGSDTDIYVIYVSTNGAIDFKSIDESNCQILKARSNLCAALRHLRGTIHPRKLWIDAICINQDDLAERNEQVARMGQIYTLAHHVVIWIGPEADGSAIALRELRPLADGIITDTETYLFWNPDYRTNHEETVASQLRGVKISSEDMIEHLFSRPYFKRLWVWQEIAMSSPRCTIQCGNDFMPWPIFATAAAAVKYAASNANLRNCAIRVLELTTKFKTDENILQMAAYREYQNPRDKIYATLALLSRSFASEFSPQYERSVEDIWRECFLAHVKVVKRLELPFQLCEPSFHSLPSAPSWVPDFAHDSDSYGMAPTRSSSGYSAADAKFIPPDILEVTGVLCSEIESVCPLEDVDFKSVIRKLHKWDQSLFQEMDSRPYIAGGSMAEALCRILSKEQVRDRLPWVKTLSIADWISTLKAVLGDFTNTGSENGHNIPFTIGKICYEAVLGRDFIRLKDGHIGTAPKGCKAGDVIVVFLGTYYPVVLRPCGSNYSVIGRGQVHGMTDGEVLLGPIPSPWTPIAWRDDSGFPRLGFSKPDVGNFEIEDPRLGRIPEPWERVELPREPHDPELIDKFRNKVTGVVMNSDPRLSPEALKARGVRLEPIRLI